MVTISVMKANGNSIRFSAYFGFAGIIKDTLTQKLQENCMTENDVFSMTIESEDIEIAWGGQFACFPNLESLTLIAQNTIRLNCFNFKDSAIRTISLNAKELWFNDGAFCDAKSLEYATCNGTILDVNMEA